MDIISSSPIGNYALVSSMVIILFVVACLLSYRLPGWLEHISKKGIALANLSGRRSSITRAKEAAILEESGPSVSKEPDFPTDWWISPTLFALENRAIFSKTVSILLGIPPPWRQYTDITPANCSGCTSATLRSSKNPATIAPSPSRTSASSSSEVKTATSAPSTMSADTGHTPSPPGKQGVAWCCAANTMVGRTTRAGS